MSAVQPVYWGFWGLRLAVLRASYFRTFYTTVSFCLSLHLMSWEKRLPLWVFASCFAVGILLVVSIRIGTHRSADMTWLTQVWCTTWPAVRTSISNLTLFGHLRGICCLIDDGMSLADAALPSASGLRQIMAARRDEALVQQHLPHFEKKYDRQRTQEINS